MEDQNPYAPPTAESEPEVYVAPAEGHDGDASSGQRVLNFMFDILGAAICGVLTVGEDLAMLEQGSIGLAVFVIYFAGFEGLTGRTFGKFVTKTKVIGPDGRMPTLGQALGRTALRLIPLDPLSFLMPGVGGWHDRWTKTRVVRLPDKVAESRRRRAARAQERLRKAAADENARRA